MSPLKKAAFPPGFYLLLIDTTDLPELYAGAGASLLAAVAPSHAGAIDVIYGLLAVGGAGAIAALGLFGRPVLESLPRSGRGRGRAGVRALRGVHSGHIGDYIAWWTAGASALGGCACWP